MFTNHFKMTGQPFVERAPVEQILRDERIQQGLARLQYFVQQGEIAVVTGKAGIGKSTLLKLFIKELPVNLYSWLYIHLTQVRTTSLLKLIINAMGESPSLGKDRLFAQILDKAKNSERQIVLIVDESQMLSSEALTDLRLLLSSAIDDRPPIRLLLSGQEDLARHLKSSRHLALLQRISVRYNLVPLTRDQTVSYIDFQMRSVDASEKIFDPEVKLAMHDYTHGVPRQINNVATACLLNAASRKPKTLSTQLRSSRITTASIGKCWRRYVAIAGGCKPRARYPPVSS